MIANYHTHTWRCNHATGTEEQYVSAALDRGINTLGFSDHTPYFFPGDYYTTFRMRPELLPDYAECIQALKLKYSGQIEICTGLEAEYYPKIFSELLDYIRDYPISYLILGQHFVGNELEGQYSGRPTSDPAVLKEYCYQAMDAMQTGLFSYFAHPDLINFHGTENTYRSLMGQTIREAKNCGIPLEINLLGINEGRHYPSRRMLEIAGEENCPVILGIDAHNPEAITNTASEQIAKEMAAEFGLTVLETTVLRPIR